VGVNNTNSVYYLFQIYNIPFLKIKIFHTSTTEIEKVIKFKESKTYMLMMKSR